MTMPRVFVIQNPHRASEDGGALRATYDLSDARRFGELVYLLSPTAKPFEPNESVIETLRDKLADYETEDHLLLIGNPALIGFATAIAADFNDGVVSLLQWNGTRSGYVSIRARLFRSVPTT